MCANFKPLTFAQVQQFGLPEIPWSELAFPSVEHTLRHYFADRKSNQFNLHLETLGTRLDHTG